MISKPRNLGSSPKLSYPQISYQTGDLYSMVFPVGFLRFGEGTPQPMAQKLRNSEIPLENEGSGARIMKKWENEGSGDLLLGEEESVSRAQQPPDQALK